MVFAYLSICTIVYTFCSAGRPVATEISLASNHGVFKYLTEEWIKCLSGSAVLSEIFSAFGISLNRKLNVYNESLFESLAIFPLNFHRYCYWERVRAEKRMV